MEQDNNKYIWLYHYNSSIKTISDFIEDSYIFGIKPEELFEYNRADIFNQMTSDDIAEYTKLHKIETLTISDIKFDMKLPCPCNLKINPSKVTAEVAINQTNLQVNTDNFYAFADEKIQEIYQNEGFKAENFNKKRSNCKVFGWFKTMYYVGVSEKDIFREADAAMLDLSAYVQSLSTMMSKNGGSFTLKLPIITASGYNGGIKSEDGKVSIDFLRAKINDWKSNMLIHSGKEFYSKNSFSSIESNYFNWLISSNDLLFISFEELKMESDPNKKDNNSGIEASPAGNVFDMIALVDDVSVVTDAPSGGAFIEVTGRDLMKLLIEDGSFFFNPSTSSDPSSVFINDDSWGKQGDVRDANTYGHNPLKRLRRISGEIDIFANRINMDIGYILKGVLSQLANIEVVPGYVFDSWGDDRTKFVDIYPDKEK